MSKGPWDKEYKGVEICRMLAAGHQKQEIAATLGISTRTVCSRLDDLREHLDAKNTYELIAILVRHGQL